MKHLLLSLLIGASLVATSFAQTAPTGQEEQARQADAIMIKMRQTDLLVQLLPLVMTKEQIKTVLPTVEKARQKVRSIQADELAQLKKLEPKLSDAVQKGIEKGDYPDRELLLEAARLTRALQIRRQIAARENIDSVFEVLNKTLNEGQLKAMANSLDPRYIDPAAKPDTMKDDQKIRLFIQDIFLDPLAYDLLVKLSR